MCNKRADVRLTSLAIHDENENIRYQKLRHPRGKIQTINNKLSTRKKTNQQ